MSADCINFKSDLTSHQHIISVNFGDLKYLIGSSKNITLKVKKWFDFVCIFVNPTLKAGLYEFSSQFNIH